MAESTFDHIVSIIREQDGIDGDITPETTFEDLGLDSLSVVEAVMECEQDYDIEIDAEANPKTVGEFVSMVDDLIAKKA